MSTTGLNPPARPFLSPAAHSSPDRPIWTAWKGGSESYLDQPALVQGAVHAARDGPRELQRAVPVAHPPAPPQAVAGTRHHATRPAQRQQREQVQMHSDR